MIALGYGAAAKTLFSQENSAKQSLALPRTLGAEETLARSSRLMKALSISRLADLTSLDRLGIPVYCAVTPLAADLTTHLGKGRDKSAAKASALMEACERICAEKLPEKPTRKTYEQMRALEANVIDPQKLALPADTEFTDTLPIDWALATELTSGAPIYVPADLVISPSQDGVLRYPNTNGLAAGNTQLEAVLHGLCEVIERDAAGRLLFADLYSKDGDEVPVSQRLNLASGVPETALKLIEEINTHGLSVEVELLTQDIQIPVCRVELIDPRFPTVNGPQMRRFPGLGCDLNAETALMRAITEAAQSRLAVIQGARDSYNYFPRRKLTSPPPARDPSEISWADVPSFDSLDMREDLTYLLDMLNAAGLDQVLHVDLTHPCIDVPVVRVIVPGLSVFFVDQGRVSWRDLQCLI
ncbi:YcaO-like family protein [Ruegeria arenilitoris]|uniref:YcaO-like family protein n=1 Tax=Ruegeria arenilitoris TaxID=1173585 RepID=UPI00147A9597|nr:YcaO-like family protein [Ruegeria arenilitoris]